jgi:hypothetical protein
MAADIAAPAGFTPDIAQVPTDKAIMSTILSVL